MDILLLLTGCIIPNCNDILKIKDVEIRKQQYITSINWYLSNTNYKIVFCENSGTDISCEFSHISDERLELLTFTSSSNTIDSSKSYKEMEILEYAYHHSRLIKYGELFVKITGRLMYINIVPTIDYLTRKIKNHKQEYVCCNLGARNIWSDSRFFFFTLPFFERLLAKKEKISIEFEFERALGAAIYEGKKDGLTFIYPPLPQRVSGIGGGVGCSYDITDEDYRYQCKRHKKRKLFYKFKIYPMFKKSHIQKYGNK